MVTMTKSYNVLYPFCGIGGGALGFQNAEDEYKGLRGKFNTLAGLDVDPEACEDFTRLTGAPAYQMDFFSKDDYEAFHGCKVPEDWREITPADIRNATKNIHPDVIFLSPPCKGYSGLLPEGLSKTPKYQALNNLGLRGVFLMVEAYREDLPSLILVENVPKITSRGRDLLRQIKQLLASYNYVFTDSTHDCGELGGLGQHRKRYLLIARLPKKIPGFVYQPPIQRVKSCGEILNNIPLPDDISMGEMHRLQRLQWKTWCRLALIPAGGDWRDLENVNIESLKINHNPRAGVYQIADWNKPCGTIIGSAKVGGSNGVAAVADPRIDNIQGYANKYQVSMWEKPAPTITGSRVGSGAALIADPRLSERKKRYPGLYKVVNTDMPCPTIIGQTDIQCGALSVADRRVDKAAHDLGYKGYNKPYLPKDSDRPDPPPVIISLDGTWHRPLTTLEMAALQGLPLRYKNGQPLVLAGKSDSRWRERIGNAVPVQSATAIAETMLRALLPAEKNEIVLGWTPIWVTPNSIGNTAVSYVM